MISREPGPGRIIGVRGGMSRVPILIVLTLAIAAWL